MGVFWSQVVNLVQPSERSAIRQGVTAPPLGADNVAPQRYSPNATLESIGMQNEALRAQIEEVEHGFESLGLVKDSFRALVSPMSELLAEFEAAKTRMHEMKIKLGVLEDAHEGLNARHTALLAERDSVAESRNVALRENREMEQRSQRVEAALNEAQRDLRESSAANEKLERGLDVEARRSAIQADEIRRVKDELSCKDRSLAELEASLKEASDQGALLSQENATLRDALQSLSSRLDAASRRIAELESQLDQDKHRLVALELALSEEQSAHAVLRAKHVEHVERSRSETSALNNTVHAVRGRVDVTNKILDQTRCQLREKLEELRAAERRLLEGGIQIDSLEKNVRSLKDDLAAANEHIAGTDRVRGALVDQVNSLNETVRVKDAALQSATHSVEQLTARIEEATTGRQRAKDELERRTTALQEEIVRLRAERQLADGALEASRNERQQARRAAAATAESPREAMAAAEPVEPPPPPSNVTKLPRTASL